MWNIPFWRDTVIDRHSRKETAIGKYVAALVVKKSTAYRRETDREFLDLCHYYLKSPHGH